MIQIYTIFVLLSELIQNTSEIYIFTVWLDFFFQSEISSTNTVHYNIWSNSYWGKNIELANLTVDHCKYVSYVTYRR